MSVYRIFKHITYNMTKTTHRVVLALKAVGEVVAKPKVDTTTLVFSLGVQVPSTYKTKVTKR